MTLPVVAPFDKLSSYSGFGDKTFLIRHVTTHDHVIKGSCHFVGFSLFGISGFVVGHNTPNHYPPLIATGHVEVNL